MNFDQGTRRHHSIHSKHPWYCRCKWIRAPGHNFPGPLCKHNISLAILESLKLGSGRQCPWGSSTPSTSTGGPDWPYPLVLGVPDNCIIFSCPRGDKGYNFRVLMPHIKSRRGCFQLSPDSLTPCAISCLRPPDNSIFTTCHRPLVLISARSIACKHIFPVICASQGDHRSHTERQMQMNKQNRTHNQPLLLKAFKVLWSFLISYLH